MLEFALGFGDPPLAWQVLPTRLASHFFAACIFLLNSSFLALHCSISSLCLDAASLMKPLVELAASTLRTAR